MPALCDIDRDGDLDVVMGGTLWYENPRPKKDPAKAPWPPHRIEQLKSHDIELADLDGDGDLDVVGRDQGKSGDVIKLWRQDGPDQWTARDLAVPKGEGLRVGDLDGDGDADVVIGGRWYKNPGRIVGGRWAEHVFGKWHETCVVEIADINQDGRSDVVLTASEAVYKGSWFEAPADPAAGPWKEHVIDDSLDFAHGVWAVDIDGDGDRDVVTAEMHQSRRDRVLVYLNQGDGLKWERVVLSTKGSHDIFIADVGKDGDLDILGANWSGPYQPVELWENRRH